MQATPGNTDDRKQLSNQSFITKLWGKLFGDKGYISKELFFQLHEDKLIHTEEDIRFMAFDKKNEKQF